MVISEFTEWVYGTTQRKSAVFSEDRQHRYFLRRPTNVIGGKGICMLIGGNPSKADEERNDLTVTKGTKWAGMWGFEWFWMLNLQALVGTDPNSLKGHPDPVGDWNDHFLRVCANYADRIVVCYGELGKETGRDKEVEALLLKVGSPEIYCFGLTKHGFPKHPSRIAYATPLERYSLKTNVPMCNRCGGYGCHDDGGKQ